MKENKVITKVVVIVFIAALVLSGIGKLFFINLESKLGISLNNEVIEEDTFNKTQDILINRGTRSPAITTRSVLVELFTGTWCSYCQGGEGALDRLANEYPLTQLSMLQYHISDSYEVTGNTNRENYYSVGGYPTAIFDGIDSHTGGMKDPDDPGMYNLYKTKLDNRIPVPSPVTVTVTGSLDASTGTINANITAIDDIPPSLTDLKARFVVYEDHNYTVYVSGREYRLRYTVVANIAEESITLSQYDNIEFTKTFSIDPSWEVEKLGAVVFVQADSTKEVLQATSFNLSALSSKVDLTLTPYDISFSDPNPYENQMVTIQATIHNVGTITSSSEVYVRFYDGDPSSGGSQIGAEQNVGIVTNGGSATAQVTWNIIGDVGDHEIVVVVDYSDSITEAENENNNKASKSITVSSGSPSQVDYIKIKDAPSGGGNWVGDSTYLLGDTDMFYAAGYNNSFGWIEDLPAIWNSDNPSTGNVDPGPSTTTIFYALDHGTCNITVNYGGLSNKTGVLSIFSYAILKPGWNLISLPLIQQDQELTIVLDSIDDYYDSVQCYDIMDTNDPWKHYKTDKFFGNDLNEIDVTMSFWIYITQPGDTIFLHNGTRPIVNQTITLYPGWNLIGYPSLINRDRNTALNNIAYGSDVDAVWTYDAATDQWKTLESSDNFELGNGYWIHSTVEKTWNVPL